MDKETHSKLKITCYEYFDEVAIKYEDKALKRFSHKQTVLHESNKTNVITSNIALREKKVTSRLFNYDSLDPRDGNLYDSINDTNGKNILNNFTGSDAKRLLCFIEVMYNTMQSLLEDLTAEQMPKGSFGVIIDIEKYCNFKKTATDLIQNIISCTPKELCAVSKDNYLKVSKEQQQCIGFKISISICEFSFSTDALNDMTMVCNATDDSLLCCETMTSPSPCFKNWHFCSITQGYWIIIILRKLNIPTLNIMRKLYFVIFRNDGPDHNIEINFKFYGVKVYDIQLLTNCLSTIMHWSSAHQNILRNMSTIHTWSLQTDDNNDSNLSGAITFPMISQNVPPIHESLNLDASSDTNEIDIIRFVLFDVESLFMKSSQSNTNITVKETTRLSFDSLFGDIVSDHSIPEPDKISVNTVKGRAFQSKSRSETNSILVNVKLWITKTAGHFQEKDLSINKLSSLKDEYINETMFESIYVNDFMEWINKKCEHFMCQTLHKSFLKCLGQSIIQLHCGTILA